MLNDDPHLIKELTHHSTFHGMVRVESEKKLTIETVQ